jgi:ISXO2-like transposase domain
MDTIRNIRDSNVFVIFSVLSIRNTNTRGPCKARGLQSIDHAKKTNRCATKGATHMPHPSTNYLIARVRDFCRWQEKLFGDPSSRGEPVTHRIRESMSDASPSPIGGDNKVVEADETYVGGKAKNRAYKPEPKKHIIMSLVERGGEVRSFHVKNATAKTLRETAVKVASRKSYLATDENPAYTKLGKEFSGHGTVNHSANEYARLGGFVHVNSAENFFSIFKRGIIGTFHHISEQHLDRYLAEFDFRYNYRSNLGIEDAERSEKAIKGAAGKRLFYQESRPAAHA